MNNKGARLAGRVRINSLAIGLVIIVMAMGTILFFQTLALNKLQTQSDQNNRIISQIQGVTTSLNKNSVQRTNQINELNRHLDCIVEFFSQPDRTQKAISDIDTCTLQNINNGATSTPSTSSFAPITTAPKSTVATTTPSSDKPTGSTGSSSSTGSPSGPTSTGSSGSTTPLGGSSNPSFLQQVVVTPLNNSLIQPVKNLLNDIL